MAELLLSTPAKKPRVCANAEMDADSVVSPNLDPTNINSSKKEREEFLDPMVVFFAETQSKKGNHRFFSLILQKRIQLMTKII